MEKPLSESRMLSTVLYRCACGCQLAVEPKQGGHCDVCGRDVTPQMLDHDLALTVTIDDSVDLNASMPSQEIESGNVADVDESEIHPEMMVGKMFGHFRLISPIGHGGMGQVYRALDTSLQRYAAVKILKSGIADGSHPDESEVDKLLQEAVSQARVTHPNVVTIYYVGKQDGDPFLAMEVVNGEPLSRRIRSGNIEFSEISSFAQSLARALSISYEIGVIHGDIKPSNILLTKNGSPKLSDFGMARDVSDQSAAVGGTPNYIAPEVLVGEKPSLQSDVYSLGVTIFEMAFGKLPVKLTGTTVSNWAESHQGQSVEFPETWPEHLPEKLKEILEKMLAKNPKDRYQDYDALIDDLELIQPNEQVVARVFPRVVAAGVDWISVLFMAGLVQAGINNESFSLITDSRPWLATTLAVAQFLPITLYFLLINSWRQSLGRRLMHLRIVNRYGMNPSSQAIMLRSAIRMQFPFIALVAQGIASFNSTLAEISLAAIFIASIAVLFVDAGLMLVTRRKTAMHDIFAQTSVVLDTKTRPQTPSRW